MAKIKGPPYVRYLFQYVCSICGDEEWSRTPWNPMSPMQDAMQELPQGWFMVIDGQNTQTPIVRCGKPGCRVQ